MIDEKLENALNIPTLIPTSEDNLSDDEDYETYAGGPSARRMKVNKKKRRSGSLSRVFTATMKNLHKAIRSTTPAGLRTQPATGSHDPSTHTPIFQSPRLGVKRKVSVDEPDMSPNSKHRRAAMEASFTPKVIRARSVSIKNRFKRKKSLTDGKSGTFKEPSLIIHHPFDGNTVKTPSLPNKPRMTSIIHTPGTPGAIPIASRDLSTEQYEDEKISSSSPVLRTISARSSKSSLASVDSNTSSKSYPGRVVKRKTSDRRYIGKPRSPSERKIGIVRRRSQEMAHKKAMLREDKVKILNNLPVLDDSYVKSQLRRGRPNTFRIKPSPMKVEKDTPDGRKTTRIKISFREGQIQSPKVDIRNPEMATENQLIETSGSSKTGLRVNESLSNLRQDISSMIEKSFGPFQDPDDPEVTFGKVDQDQDNDKYTVEELTLPRLPSSLLTRSMRRQSSAFEVQSGRLPMPTSNVRRQSSAFELAALAKQKSDETANFNRGVTTRASLKQRNSSVKDLVKKLEVAKIPDSDDEVFALASGSSKRMSMSTSGLPALRRDEFKLPSPPKETPARPSVPEVIYFLGLFLFFKLWMMILKLLAIILTSIMNTKAVIRVDLLFC